MSGCALSGQRRSHHATGPAGLSLAGMHFLVDLWGAMHTSDASLIGTALHDAAITAGATALHTFFHTFTPNGGVAGVLVLAESHITIHMSPEHEFAAVDVFMCGACDPHETLSVLTVAFRPTGLRVIEVKRGGRPSPFQSAVLP